MAVTEEKMCISTLEFPTSCSLFFHSIKNGFEIGGGGKRDGCQDLQNSPLADKAVIKKSFSPSDPETFSWGDDGLFIFLGRKNLFFSPPPPPS